ncbi:MAG: hypothetical protein ACRCZE_03020 [Candidatus Altimarinota bacterium]
MDKPIKIEDSCNPEFNFLKEENKKRWQERDSRYRATWKDLNELMSDQRLYHVRQPTHGKVLSEAVEGVRRNLMVVIGLNLTEEVIGKVETDALVKENRLAFGKEWTGELDIMNRANVEELGVYLSEGKAEGRFNVNAEDLSKFDFARLEGIPKIYHSTLLHSLLEKNAGGGVFDHLKKFKLNYPESEIAEALGKTRQNEAFANYCESPNAVRTEEDQKMLEGIWFILTSPW